MNPEEERGWGDALEETDMSALHTGRRRGTPPIRPPGCCVLLLALALALAHTRTAPPAHLSELLLQTALHVQYTAFAQEVAEEHGA